MRIAQFIFITVTRKFSDKVDMQKLQITMKPIHGTTKFEVHAKVLTNAKDFLSEVTDHNIFFVLDKAMKKLEQQFG